MRGKNRPGDLRVDPGSPDSLPGVSVASSLQSTVVDCKDCKDVLAAQNVRGGGGGDGGGGGGGCLWSNSCLIEGGPRRESVRDPPPPPTVLSEQQPRPFTVGL